MRPPAIPDVPASNFELHRFLSAIKERLELLAGERKQGVGGTAVMLPDQSIPTAKIIDAAVTRAKLSAEVLEALDLETLVDAKGDILAATAADTLARLAAGADDLFLITKAAQATGLKWGGVNDFAADAAPDLAADKLATWDASASAHKSVLMSKLHSQEALLSYQVASGSHGGSSTGGSWQTRPLNTEVYDPDGIVSLSANQFTLGAGTYDVSASGVFACDAGSQINFRHRIRNVTDGTTAALGNVCRLHVAAGESAAVEAGIPVTRFTIAASKAFELQYYAQIGKATYGLGYTDGATAAEAELYAWVYIKRVG